MIDVAGPHGAATAAAAAAAVNLHGSCQGRMGSHKLSMGDHLFQGVHKEKAD